MDCITSVQNALVKECCKLKNTANRRTAGLFLIEGVKLCKEAIISGIQIKYCFWSKREAVREALDLCDPSVLIQTTDRVIEKLSEAKAPQHIVAVAEMPQRSDAEISGRVVLALDGISDPANLGSILRTAEAFGVTDIVCSDTTVDLYSTKVLRGAMGSSFRVSLHRGNLAAYLSALKGRGYKLFATGLDRSAQKLQHADFAGKCVVVIGNEGNGICEEIFSLCEHKIIIPMVGKNESLNAAAAAAVILWQCFTEGGNE